MILKAQLLYYHHNNQQNKRKGMSPTIIYNQKKKNLMLFFHGVYFLPTKVTLLKVIKDKWKFPVMDIRSNQQISS